MLWTLLPGGRILSTPKATKGRSWSASVLGQHVASNLEWSSAFLAEGLFQVSAAAPLMIFYRF